MMRVVAFVSSAMMVSAQGIDAGALLQSTKLAVEEHATIVNSDGEVVGEDVGEDIFSSVEFDGDGHVVCEVSGACPGVFPTSVGCYVFLPTGCQSRGFDLANVDWYKDTQGMTSNSQCHDRVKTNVDSYDRRCDKTDAVFYFVPEKTMAPTPAPTAAPVAPTQDQNCECQNLRYVLGTPAINYGPEHYYTLRAEELGYPTGDAAEDLCPEGYGRMTEFKECYGMKGEYVLSDGKPLLVTPAYQGCAGHWSKSPGCWMNGINGKMYSTTADCTVSKGNLGIFPVCKRYCGSFQPPPPPCPGVIECEVGETSTSSTDVNGCAVVVCEAEVVTDPTEVEHTYECDGEATAETEVFSAYWEYDHCGHFGNDYHADLCGGVGRFTAECPELWMPEDGAEFLEFPAAAHTKYPEIVNNIRCKKARLVHMLKSTAYTTQQTSPPAGMSDATYRDANAISFENCGVCHYLWHAQYECVEHA